MNKAFVLVASTVASLSSASSNAATVSLETLLFIPPTIEEDAAIFGSDAPNGSIENTLTEPGTGQSSSGSATFDENGRRLSAAAHILHTATSPEQSQRGLGRAKSSESLSVVTAGSLLFEFDLIGSFNVVSDLSLEDDDTYASLFAALTVVGPSSTQTDDYWIGSSPTQRELTFSNKLSLELFVDAGDLLTIDTRIQATTGSTADITAFLEADSSLEGILTITTNDGASIEYGDLAPVPLPAALPMLLAGICALGMMRRRV